MDILERLKEMLGRFDSVSESPDTISGTMRDAADEIARLRAENEALRVCLAETAGVAVTMLYESHRADTLKEFTVEELSKMVETTKHLADANVQVEEVYRKAWDMAHGCYRQPQENDND